jgi:hypothetical protein
MKYISDYSVKEFLGGSELVDDTIINFLKCDFVKSSELVPNINEFYILSNTSLMKPEYLNFIKDNCKYIIVEHDYKIHASRHPWRFKDNIVPHQERISYDLYKNARAVFVQTKDHLNIMRRNDVEANFIDLNCSIWSDTELNVLRSKIKNNSLSKNFAIVNSKNWIKNTGGAVEFCKNHKLNYDLIGSSDYTTFIEQLSNYSTLVFFPIARETCCRLLVEARCLGMNVITNSNSGAFLADWFIKREDELIGYLSEQSKTNLNNIQSFCN